MNHPPPAAALKPFSNRTYVNYCVRKKSKLLSKFYDVISIPRKRRRVQQYGAEEMAKKRRRGRKLKRWRK